MYLKNFCKDLNLSKNDSVYLIGLTIFSIILTVHLINLNYTINFKPDSFVYLVNGLVYAGLQGNIQNYSYSLFLTPVISFLTSILFRLGIVDKVAIMIVTGIIAILGQIGLYLLLKVRFNELLSLFGCILFGSLNVILINWGTGGIDLPVCCFTIFTILFMILAVNKNPKYYILTSIFLVLAIFTKYVAFFLIPILCLCFLSKHDFFNLLDLALSDKSKLKNVVLNYIKSQEFKYMLIAIILAIVLFTVICGVILSLGSHLTFITQTHESLNGFNNSNATRSIFFHDDKSYYFEHLEKTLYPIVENLDLSLLIPIIIAIGAIFSIGNNFKNRNEYELTNDYNNPYLKYLLISLIIILIPISIWGFEYISHMLTNICFLVICVCILSLAGKINIDKNNFDLNILFLAWFFIFIIFYSFITIKVSRYLAIATPPIIYFVLLSIENIFYKFKNTNIFKIVLIVILIILACYSLTYDFGEHKSNEFNNTDIQNVYDYLIEYDSDYKSKNLTSDYSYGSRFGTWMLKKDVDYVKKRNLDISNSDYIISKRDMNLTNYTHIYNSGKIHLYQNIKYY